jgi:two-component system, NtrC family, response regulator HydG
MPQILVVDDDTAFCLMLKTFLVKKGFQVDTAFSFSEALITLKTQRYELVISDIRLPDRSGLELLAEARRILPETKIILMTGYGDIRSAVNAIKMGAFEYVTKPVNPDEVLLTIKQALSAKTNQKTENHIEYVKGVSEASARMDEYIALVAPTDMSVLILGESGTGKEYVARKIHQESKRSKAPFVAIDCGALPKDLATSEFFGHLKGSFTGAVSDKTGQFVAANKGTIFLDEVGNLSYDVQIQLLRAIQERKVRPIGSNREIEVDVRIIAATNEDLRKAVQNGSFREDLFHRLNEFAIDVPGLSQRGDDLKLFVQYFLEKSNAELQRNVGRISEEVVDIFKNYPWPGNIRELRNVMKRAVLLTKGDLLQVEVLPREMISADNKSVATTLSFEESNDLKELKDKMEKQKIVAVLEKTKYNKSKAAELLNIDRKTLYNKMKLFGLD